MSSPWRISCRARDSSNKAAKFSGDGAGWLVVAVAMSNRCPIALSVATGVTAGRLVIPSLGDCPLLGPARRRSVASRFLVVLAASALSAALDLPASASDVVLYRSLCA